MDTKWTRRQRKAQVQVQGKVGDASSRKEGPTITTMDIPRVDLSVIDIDIYIDTQSCHFRFKAACRLGSKVR